MAEGKALPDRKEPVAGAKSKEARREPEKHSHDQSPAKRVVRDPSLPLPAYILERNAQAIAAGLTVETQTYCRDGRLKTWYRGTEQQWRASPFCRRKRHFVEQHKYSDFKCYSLSHGGLEALQVRRRGKGKDDYRGVIHESIPEWSEDAGDGVMAYGLENDSRIAYVGPLETMTARGIVPPDKEVNGYLRSPAEECYRFPDGRALYIDWVSAREKAAAREAEKRRIEEKTPDEWLRHIAAQAHAAVEVFALETLRTPTENKDGKLFVVDKRSCEAVATALKDLVAAVRSAKVRVTDATVQPDEESVTSARGDQAFAAFLSSAGVSRAIGQALR